MSGDLAGDLSDTEHCTNQDLRNLKWLSVTRRRRISQRIIGEIENMSALQLSAVIYIFSRSVDTGTGAAGAPLSIFVFLLNWQMFRVRSTNWIIQQLYNTSAGQVEGSQVQHWTVSILQSRYIEEERSVLEAAGWLRFLCVTGNSGPVMLSVLLRSDPVWPATRTGLLGGHFYGQLSIGSSSTYSSRWWWELAWQLTISSVVCLVLISFLWQWNYTVTGEGCGWPLPGLLSLFTWTARNGTSSTPPPALHTTNIIRIVSRSGPVSARRIWRRPLGCCTLSSTKLASSAVVREMWRRLTTMRRRSGL